MGGRSEKRTDWLGNEYIQHFDENGVACGRSVKHTDWMGNESYINYDEKGNELGRSTQQEGFFGGKYTLHTDKKGNEIGRSTQQEGFFRGTYTRHTDKNGNEVGRSTQQTDWMGNSYTSHTGSGYSSSSTSGGTSSGNEKVSLTDAMFPDTKGMNLTPHKPAKFDIHFAVNIGVATFWMCVICAVMILIPDVVCMGWRWILRFAGPASAVISAFVPKLLASKQKLKGGTAIYVVHILMSLFLGIVVVPWILRFCSSSHIPEDSGSFFTLWRCWLSLPVYGFVLGVVTLISAKRDKGNEGAIYRISKKCHAVYSSFLGSAVMLSLLYIFHLADDYSSVLSRLEFLIMLLLMLTVNAALMIVGNFPYWIFSHRTEY